MTKYEAIQLHEQAEIRHLVTQEDIHKFVELTGDDNKLHTDQEYARKTAYKKPVVHGMLGASFISTIIGTKLPGDGALWFAQNLEFLLPVHVGDELTIRAEVLKKIDSMQAIEIRTEIFNQHKQKVTTGTAKVKIVEREEAPEQAEESAPLRKVALVIGGSGGIGSAACLQLAKDGFDIAIHYMNNRELAESLKVQVTALGRKALIVSADATNAEHAEEMVKGIVRKFGAITVLVNCATIKIPAIKFAALEWSDVQNHFDINIRVNFNLLKCVVPIMELQKYGKIIHITSQAIETPTPEWLPYITAKAALQGFSKTLAVELAPKGIRVNMISPGMTETDLISDIPEKTRLLAAARTPLRRLARPQDVAAAIGFLASEQSDYLVGETIRINGGQVMI